MKVIETKNLVKIYNDSEVNVLAVNGIDLSFEQGEFAAIVGPSGSGKTTFLNMLGGLDYPSSGEVKVGDENISEIINKTVKKKRKKYNFFMKEYNMAQYPIEASLLQTPKKSTIINRAIKINAYCLVG